MDQDDLARLLDLVGSGVVVTDDELIIGSANAAAHRFADRASGTMVGLSVLEAFVDVGLERLARTARDDGEAAGELALGPPNGPTLVVRARRGPDGGVWLVLDDVTELRRLERIRAEFAGNISHELRTPLSTVSLLAETLVREAETAGEAIPPRMRDRI